MPDISKITLPSGNTYDIKDAVARQAIAGSVSFITAWNGTSTPTVANIPKDVVVKYNGTNYTGTLEANDAQAVAFYLVKSATQKDNSDIYDEYVPVGTTGNKVWEKLGDTQVLLGDLGELAYKDSVIFDPGTSVGVLTSSAVLTGSSSSVSFTGGTTDKVLGSDATFTTTVTPSTTNIKATASGTAVGANGTANAVTGYASPVTDKVLGSDATFTTTVTPTVVELELAASGTSVGADGTDTFVKSYPGTSSKLVTTSVPNVTGNTSATLTFSMGTGNDAETLIIGGTGFVQNTYTATNTTLGTAITAATGSLAANGGGGSVMTGLGTASTASALTGVKVTAQPSVQFRRTDEVLPTSEFSVVTGITSATTVTNSKDEVTAMTGLGTPSTSTVLTGVKVTSQPTVSLATGATAGTGVISVATGISSASTTTNNKDEVTAVTNIGTGTAAGQTVTASGTATANVSVYGTQTVTVS